MFISPGAGLFIDQPRIMQDTFWSTGLNVRFRLNRLETMGLYGPLKTPADTQITLSASDPYRALFPTPCQAEGKIIAGAANKLDLIIYDPASTPTTGTRWRTQDMTPAGLPAATDFVPNPSTGRVEIPPVWWFADQDDLAVTGRTNVQNDVIYYWDRNPANVFVPLSNVPTGAVGGAIVNRILVLLGATSFTDPDPQRFMTVRWSDRFNFEDWTPSDTNVSGEFQLEGGSRIVGGGFSGFGVMVWTDKRLAVLNETGDPNSVFARRYVDGGRGLLSNRAWCEADGRVWWLDEHRVLNAFDGGRPRQIPNPLKYATIERLSDPQVARIYMTPNVEHGEIILHYPSWNTENPDRQLVYNYLYDAWSVWDLDRTAYSNRYGVIRPLGISLDGNVWQHELDASLPETYITGPVPPGDVPNVPGAGTPIDPILSSADVSPYAFFALTNLVASAEVTDATWAVTRVLADHLPSPAEGAETDKFYIVANGYGETTPVPTGARLSQDWQEVVQGQDAVDMRVSGKALQIGVYGSGLKTVFGFSGFHVTPAQRGVR